MSSVKQIIDVQCGQFLKVIQSRANSNFNNHFHKNDFAFSIFDDDTAFEEQKIFEEIIENSIWRYLVNGILHEIFKDKGLTVNWTEMHQQLSMSFVEKIEKSYPVEFVICNNGETIGYRYTNCYYSKDCLDSIFASKNIDRLVVINFSALQSCKKVVQHIPPSYKEKITQKTFKEFFVFFFDEKYYELYFDATTHAIKNARQYVGLKTVRNLTEQYHPFFVDSVLQDLEISAFSMQRYERILTRKKMRMFVEKMLTCPKHTILNEDYAIMNDTFYTKKKYLILGKQSTFARSFITSEYLYQTMRENNNFDYTPIVCGYLKSIEQFLEKVMFYMLDVYGLQNLWIKSNTYPNDKDDIRFRKIKNESSRKIWHTRFEDANIDFFDTSFVSLVHLLNSCKSIWKIRNEAINKISAYLFLYCDECRNGHFHKDNIDDVTEVETIRNNTYLLFYYLIGGLCLPNDF